MITPAIELLRRKINQSLIRKYGPEALSLIQDRDLDLSRSFEFNIRHIETKYEHALKIHARKHTGTAA